MNIHSKSSSPSHRIDPVSGRLGKLTTRLAISDDEIRKAQNIRYRVFQSDRSGESPAGANIEQIDGDRYDPLCDHLLVIDSSRPQADQIVGTQRFAVRAGSEGPEDFYSAQEFDLSHLLANHPDKNFMELGRSCILPEYREKRTLELLWHGTWDYALKKRTDVMIGCASFPTTNADAIREELAFLASLSASDTWQVKSIGENTIDLKALAGKDTDMRSALRKLPPLIKGYIRLGARFSNLAFCDHKFGTIDVLVVLPVEDINPKYVAYYGENAERHRSR